MKQYDELGLRIVNEGSWVVNERTGTKCLTVINADLEYDLSAGVPPLVTSRKTPYKGAVSEFLGYLRGYDNAADFRALGSNTWNANANENEAWCNNPNRKGIDDMGRVYGVQLRDWRNSRGQSFDQLIKVVDHLKRGIDDRGEILTFWNPGEFDLGCLRPCMHTHHFSILGSKLYLNSFSRSVDWALGLPANMLQAYLFLQLMCRITGLLPGSVYHKLVNIHIYDNQLLLAKEQLSRKQWDGADPTLDIHPRIQTLDDIQNVMKWDDVIISNYTAHDPIKYPFTV